MGPPLDYTECASAGQKLRSPGWVLDWFWCPEMLLLLGLRGHLLLLPTQRDRLPRPCQREAGLPWGGCPVSVQLAVDVWGDWGALRVHLAGETPGQLASVSHCSGGKSSRRSSEAGQLGEMGYVGWAKGGLLSVFLFFFSFYFF